MSWCPKCRIDLPADLRFCPNCGAELVAAPLSGSAPPAEIRTTAPQEHPKRSRIRIAAVAAIIVVLLVLVSLFGVIPAVMQIRSGSAQTNCPLGSGSLTLVSTPSPNYDVQEVMVFAQSYSQLEFNVTAVAQCDANGYGPAYLLNGLSNTGYWYQVGINWTGRSRQAVTPAASRSPAKPGHRAEGLARPLQPRSPAQSTRTTWSS